MTLLAAKWNETDETWELYADRKATDPETGGAIYVDKTRKSDRLRAVFSGDSSATSAAWTVMRKQKGPFTPESLTFDSTKGYFEAFVVDRKTLWWVSNEGAEIVKPEKWVFLGSGAPWAEGYVWAREEFSSIDYPDNIFAAVSVMNGTVGLIYDTV